jgi:hypothetical protein
MQLADHKELGVATEDLNPPLSTIALRSPNARIRVLFLPPNGGESVDTPLSGRKEPRIAVKMFVNIYSEDNPSTEVAPTIDISCHGARVVSKRRWQPNQQVSVRSIRGDFYSRARVVHCQPYEDNSFVVGSKCIIQQAIGHQTT